MKRSKSKNELVVGLLIFAAAFVACGRYEKNDKESLQNEAEDSAVPYALIDLSTAGVGAHGNLALSDTSSECKNSASLGIFGLPLMIACQSVVAIQRSMYGVNPDRNGDGQVTCRDYDHNDPQHGFLQSMLCEPAMQLQSEVKSVKFRYAGKNDGISFEDFSSPSLSEKPVGSWTALGPEAGRYPAKIRAWEGESVSTMAGVGALELKNGLEGNLYIDFHPRGKDAYAEAEFSGKIMTEDCERTPNKESCNWTEVKIKGKEDASRGEALPGVHAMIYSNKTLDADFFVLEGNVRLTESSANNFVNSSSVKLPASFRDVRKIYFRLVQKGRQIWGSMDYEDQSGRTISASYPVGSASIDVTKVLRDGFTGESYAGVCQDLGTSEITNCRDIDGADYVDTWVGDGAFTEVDADYKFPINFGAAPTQDGFVK